MDASQTIKDIKQQFMARRNGIVADALRKGGETYSLIYGLQVPDLAAIARTLEPSMALADSLWAEKQVRECRLLACYLWPAGEVGFEKALTLCNEVLNREEADMLGFRLIKRLDYAAGLVEMLRNSNAPLGSYMAEAIERHLS